jgi:hypothetical protein
MKKSVRCGLGYLLTFVMTLSAIVVTPTTSMQAEAAAKKYVKSLSVKKNVTVEKGKKVVVKPTVKVSGKASKKLTVKTQSKKIAKVSYSAKKNTITITGVKVGSTTVTVTTKAKNKKGKAISKKIKVTVKKSTEKKSTDNSGNTTTEKSNTTENEKQESTEQPKTEESVQEEVIPAADVEKYKEQNMDQYRNALDNNGISYEMPEDGSIVIAKTEYEVLKYTYENEYNAVCYTDYTNSQIRTDIYVTCEYHSEKGLPDKELQALYGFILATGDEKLIKQFGSAEELNEKLLKKSYIFSSFSTLEITGSKLKLISHPVQSYEKVDVETKYMEFDTVDEYDAFQAKLPTDNEAVHYGSSVSGNAFAFYTCFYDGNFEDISEDEMNMDVYAKEMEEACEIMGVDETTKDQMVAEARLWCWCFSHDLISTWYWYDSKYQCDWETTAHYSFEIGRGSVCGMRFVFPVKVDGMLQKR